MNIWRSVMIYMAVIAAILAMVLLSTSNSDAQQRQLCADKVDMLDIIYQAFNQYVVWEGDVSQDVKVVMTRSDDGSWTILTVVNEIACVFAGGYKSRFDKGV